MRNNKVQHSFQHHRGRGKRNNNRGGFHGQGQNHGNNWSFQQQQTQGIYRNPNFDFNQNQSQMHPRQHSFGSRIQRTIGRHSPFQKKNVIVQRESEVVQGGSIVLDNNFVPLVMNINNNNFRKQDNIHKGIQHGTTSNVVKTIINRPQQPPPDFNKIYNGNSYDSSRGRREDKFRTCLNSMSTGSLLVAPSNNSFSSSVTLPRNNRLLVNKVEQSCSMQPATKISGSSQQQQVMTINVKDQMKQPAKPSFTSIIQSTERMLMKHGAYDRNETNKSNRKTLGNSETVSTVSRNSRQDAQIVINWQNRQERSPPGPINSTNSFLQNETTVLRNSRGFSEITPLQKGPSHDNLLELGKNGGDVIRQNDRLDSNGKTVILRRRAHSPIQMGRSSGVSTNSHQPQYPVQSSAIREQKCNLDIIIKKCTGRDQSPFTTWELFDVYTKCIESGITVPLDDTYPL